MDKKIAGLKASVDLTRTWIHVDMDAFYAAVEELHDPSLVCPARLSYCMSKQVWQDRLEECIRPSFMAGQGCISCHLSLPVVEHYIKP